MIRILSGIVLIAAFGSAIWFLTTVQLLLVAEAVVVLAFVEYATLAEALGARIPRIVAGTATVLAAASMGLSYPIEPVLVAALIAVGAVFVGGRAPAPGVLGDASAALFPVLYLGVPIGALVSVHALAGRDAVLLLLTTVVVSDTAQYFSGRLFGRHKLSPVISPKKTVEGAVGGFIIGPAVMTLLGAWWLPNVSTGMLLLLGLLVVGLGIAGDLFESLLKRSAGVKDSSALIPGHGGVLDRIDALLFAAPAFYLFLKYGV
jgi:phosphatidate cytidylyltransferase